MTQARNDGNRWAYAYHYITVVVWQRPAGNELRIPGPPRLCLYANFLKHPAVESWLFSCDEDKQVAAVIAATGCIAAAARIAQSYSPCGANVHRCLLQGPHARDCPVNCILIGLAVFAGLVDVPNAQTEIPTTLY